MDRNRGAAALGRSEGVTAVCPKTADAVVLDDEPIEVLRVVLAKPVGLVGLFLARLARESRRASFTRRSMSAEVCSIAMNSWRLPT